MKETKNSNLNKAGVAKNDEFYTQLEDVEREIKHYKQYFKGKKVFCNCDDPEWSAFWRYFSENFEHLGLKKLVSTHYKKDNKSYKLEITQDINGDGKLNKLDILKTNLDGDGDFRSQECLEILKDSDIVVTNPPFSLFSEYIEQLMKNDKKFLIIGNFNAVTLKSFFPLLMGNKIWAGISPRSMDFITENGDKKSVNAKWWTNLEHSKRYEEIFLHKKFLDNKEIYNKYDGYDIIDVSKVNDIPCDYNGIMGVPITFLEKYNPEQFEILGIANSARYIGLECYTKINGEKIYNRILIKNKKL